MTEKRFTVTQDFEEHYRQIRDNGHIIMGCFVEPQAEVIVNLLNELAEENEQLKKELKAYKNFSDRKLAENKRIHKDWDKLWQLCTDNGFTEEELIKELER